MTLNHQLKTIESFNNAVVAECIHRTWGHVVTLEATKFAANGIERELNLKLTKVHDRSNKYMFVSTLNNI